MWVPSVLRLFLAVALGACGPAVARAPGIAAPAEFEVGPMNGDSRRICFLNGVIVRCDLPLRDAGECDPVVLEYDIELFRVEPVDGNPRCEEVTTTDLSCAPGRALLLFTEQLDRVGAHRVWFEWWEHTAACCRGSCPGRVPSMPARRARPPSAFDATDEESRLRSGRYDIGSDTVPEMGDGAGPSLDWPPPRMVPDYAFSVDESGQVVSAHAGQRFESDSCGPERRGRESPRSTDVEVPRPDIFECPDAALRAPIRCRPTEE